jgi:hypothetical protein
MKITGRESKIKSIKQGDSNFWISDGITLTARAGFEVNNLCPKEYRSIIAECLNNGWLKPVAHVTDYELLLMTLERN